MGALISIITINRNNSKGLKRTIKSVNGQNFRDFEHIIIDGASTDDSVYVIKQSCFSSVRRIWLSEQDKGIYNAMNKGIFMSGGKYCIFMNSGDFFSNDDVLNMVFSESRKADILVGYVIEEQTNRIIYPASKPTSFQLLNKGFPHQGVFTKTSLLRQYGGFNETYSILADLEMHYHLLHEGASVEYLNSQIAFVECGGISSDPRNDQRIKAEIELIIQTYRPWWMYLRNSKLYSKLLRKFA